MSATADGVHFDPESGLNYELWKSQEDAINHFMNDKSVDITDFRAGFRSGKSIAGSRAIIKAASDIPQSRWAVMAHSYREGIRATFEVLFEQLPEYDGENPESSPLVDEYHKQDMILRLVNGSKILLSTAQKPDSLKGTELNGAWLDEAAFYSDLYDLLKMVLSRMSADISTGIMITTTTAGYNDYYHITEELEHPETGEKINWNIETVTADVRNNPFLSQEVKDRLVRTHEDNKEMGLKGGFTASKGRVYDKFNRNDHVIKSKNYTLVDNWRVFGMDFGWDDPMVVIELGKTTDGRLVVVDEYYKSEAEIEDACDWINKKPNGKIYADWSPREKNQVNKEVNNRIENAYKDIDSGIYAIKQRLKQKDDKTGLIIDDKCHNLIKEFLGYKQDDIGGQNVDDHALDSLRYAISSPRQSELEDMNDRVKYAIARSSNTGTDVQTNQNSNDDSEETDNIPEPNADKTQYLTRKENISNR